MKRLTLNSITFKNLKKLMLGDFFKKKTIFNFVNSNSIYFFKGNRSYEEYILNEKNFNFIDGAVISIYLKGKRLRGPSFTKTFFQDKDLLKNKKHFFIGLNKEDLGVLCEKCPLLKRKNIFSYVPPYIKETFIFPEKELNKIIKLINKQKIDYLWIGIGSPKQKFMSHQIYDLVNLKYIFNVGAALEFLLKKKKEAPTIIQKLGLEWLYRLITDFNYSKKKVWQSLLGSFYMIGRIQSKKH